MAKAALPGAVAILVLSLKSNTTHDNHTGHDAPKGLSNFVEKPKGASSIPEQAGTRTRKTILVDAGATCQKQAVCSGCGKEKTSGYDRFEKTSFQFITAFGNIPVLFLYANERWSWPNMWNRWERVPLDRTASINRH